MKSVSSDLEIEDKKRIVRELQKIIRLDEKAHFYEIEMFNEIANALDLTPAELVQL